MTEINGRKVDLRNAEPKISDKIAQINKDGKDNSVKAEPVQVPKPAMAVPHSLLKAPHAP